jgi:hypothetical protein
MAEAISFDEWPAIITLSGLPPWLAGWNGELRKTNNLSDGAPVYENPEHEFLGVVVAGIRVLCHEGSWICVKNECLPHDPSAFKDHAEQQGSPTPLHPFPARLRAPC